MKFQWHSAAALSRTARTGSRTKGGEHLRRGHLLGASAILALLLLSHGSVALAADSTYTAWARQHFGSDVDDPAKEATVWGTNADPDHDGRVNLLEYALGNDPKSGADVSAGIIIELKPIDGGGSDRYLHATVNQRASDPGLLFTPQVSSDGHTWQEGLDFVVPVPPEVAIDSNFKQVVYRDKTPVSPEQPRLFRLKIAVPDTDNDGLPDGWELKYFGNLSQTPDGDADNDGLINQQEWFARTSPILADTDGDGMPDAWELASGLDPLVNDSAADLDGDGAPNWQDARPNDSAIGVLTIRITSPLDGSTIP